MSLFVCKVLGCANDGVEYNFDDESVIVAECGGCKSVLSVQPVVVSDE